MRMPFGKYRGWEIADLPDEYLQWLVTIELREPLFMAVVREIDRRAFSSQKKSRSSVPAPLMAKEIVKAGYRALAMKYHPDHGGDGKKMVELNLAYEKLLQEVS